MSRRPLRQLSAERRARPGEPVSYRGESPVLAGNGSGLAEWPLASGLPVVGIRSPGIADTIEDGVTGYLAPEEDLAAFTAKLSRIVTDTENREKMAQRAKQSASLYSIENTTDIMQSRYQEIWEVYGGRKKGIFSRLMQPFKRIRR